MRQRQRTLKPHLDILYTHSKAVAAVARSATRMSIKLESYRCFSSPDVEAIVRQIYANKLVLEQHDHLN